MINATKENKLNLKALTLEARWMAEDRMAQHKHIIHSANELTSLVKFLDVFCCPANSDPIASIPKLKRRHWVRAGEKLEFSHRESDELRRLIEPKIEKYKAMLAEYNERNAPY